MHFENEVEQHTKLLIASYPRLLADKAQQTMLASIANAKKSPAFLTSVLSLLGMKAVLADPPENSDPNQLAILVSDALQDLLLATSTPATPGSARAGADDVGSLPETTRTGGLAPANAPPGFLKYDNGGSIGELDTRSRSGDESDEEEKRSRGSVFEGLAVKPGTSHIANLLPYGSFTKDKFAEQVPLGRQADKIVSLYYSSVQDGIVYVDPNESGLRIGDSLLILEATPFPVKEVSEDNDKKKSNIFKTCANKEVPVGTDFDYANEDFEPSKHDLQKNAALLVKQKLLREEIFKLILPSAQASAYVVDMLETPTNFQAYREMALSHAPEDDPEFNALSAEDQTSWCYFAARSAAASGAKIAADKAALVAHYFTGKDAEDQLKRFTNVQPQAESVKDEVWSRKAKATYKASASDEAGTKLRMNEYDSLSRALKGGAKQNNFGNNFKLKTAGKNNSSKSGKKRKTLDFTTNKEAGSGSADPPPPKEGGGYKGNNFKPYAERAAAKTNGGSPSGSKFKGTPQARAPAGGK